MRTMYDDIRAASIPRNAQIVAGYIDTHPGGENPWTIDEWMLFPNALWVPIAVFVPGLNEHPIEKAKANVNFVKDVLKLPPGSTIVFDNEASNWTAGDQFRGPWAENIRGNQYSPTIYTSKGNWVKERWFDDNWIADYTHDPNTQIAGAAAVQFEDHGPGGTDVSTVWDNNWPRRPGGKPPVPPSQSKAVPPSALPIREIHGGWSGPDTTDPKNELDIWMLGQDGHVYHKWFHPTEGWNGPEIVDEIL